MSIITQHTLGHTWLKAHTREHGVFWVTDLGIASPPADNVAFKFLRGAVIIN